MSRFVTNINEYLSVKKIKQTYISSFSGIDVKKLSRILTGAQEVTGSDMEKIAAALGKKVEFFLQENFTVSPFPDSPYYSFYPRPDSANTELELLIEQLAELLLNADDVLSAGKFFNHSDADSEVFF